MDFGHLGRQDGFVREIVWYLAVLVIICVIVFDGVAVTKAHLGVRQNATDAADEALNTYIQSGNPGMAKDSASALLKVHGSQMVANSFKLRRSVEGPDHATVTVGARRATKTYLLRYLEGVPWGVGPWFHRLLNPSAVETND